jgi:hypothetical protein
MDDGGDGAALACFPGKTRNSGRIAAFEGIGAPAILPTLRLADLTPLQNAAIPVPIDDP